METAIWILHLLSAITVIVLVLLQHGKGADMGAAFGSGSSGSLFGASGSANFLSRTTGVLAAVFFITSLGLTYLSSHKIEDGGVMDKAVPVEPAKPAEAAPEVPADGGASKATEIPE
ncbi:preprotein translocase subunit SecG [Nitrosospira briensis]|uniref:preprotein translocase subunit SecG n=1 Tax=Nitrosospira briensis TaxID=35799 RepID=UPI0008E1A3AE|nr:preprotein translocase subunit SecG [Nitrosospira briensis]SFN63504.1 protein translocase subunit secG [Nitrosospira briensis]